MTGCRQDVAGEPNELRSGAEHGALDLLSSRAFVGALAVLLLNDLVLKHTFPGIITGKLSDFAGLFVLPVFCTALLPRRRHLIHGATAVAFVWWKLPGSAAFIDWWNGWGPWTIGRTVDPSDLIALSAVALACWFSARPRAQVRVAGVRWAVVPVAIFAFGATTFMGVHRYERTYRFRANPAELREHMRRIGVQERIDTAAPPVSPRPDGTGELNVYVAMAAGGRIGADLVLQPDSVGSAVTLRALHYCGYPDRNDSTLLIDVFERCFVQRLDSLMTDGRMMRESSVIGPGGPARFDEWCTR